MKRAKQGRVRIIAGRWRRARLSVPRRPGLRPTPDRVRETLFNWLNPDVQGARCLDLFAGTGALGFEAASRGAAEVVMVERDPEAFRALQENVRNLQAQQVRILRADAMDFIRTSVEVFDIVFLDPPFGEFDLARLCQCLEHHGRLKPRGRVYLESDASGEPSLVPEGWLVLRSGRAGRVRYDLVTPGL